MPPVPSEQREMLEATMAQLLRGQEGNVILPVYIGGICDWLLMGVVLAQSITYLRFVRTDKKRIVVLVCLSVLATSVASILLATWLTELFVWGFGTYLPFLEVDWFVRYMSAHICVTFLVQIFYIDRACRLYRHWWPALVIGPTTIGGSIAGIYLLAFWSANLSLFSPSVYEIPTNIIATNAWLLQVLISDVLITIIISYGLYRAQTGWSSTDSKLRLVMVRCIETQVPALLVAIAIFALQANEQPQWVKLGAMLDTKIYVVGLLATLNIRVNMHSPQMVAGSNNMHPSPENTYHSSKLREEGGVTVASHATQNPISVQTEVGQHPAPTDSSVKRISLNRSRSTTSNAASAGLMQSGLDASDCKVPISSTESAFCDRDSVKVVRF